MRVLVLGGNRYIGLSLVRELARGGEAYNAAGAEFTSILGCVRLLCVVRGRRPRPV